MKKIVLTLFILISVLSFGFSNDQKEILKLVNIERVQRGLKPLVLNEKLNTLAKVKSEDMAKNNYFSHNSKQYGSPFDMLRKYEVKYMTAAENIAKGQKTPKHTVESWMASEGHKKNILNPRFTMMGVSRDFSGQNIWTQLFLGEK